MTEPGDARPCIEAFDPTRHDRSTFSCGVEPVDNFFKRTANKLAEADNLRVFVMVSPEGGIIGFIALNAFSIDYRELPAKFARTRPGHGNIPAAFISMIGVDRRFAGNGYGGDLLIDGLSRIVRASDELGIAVVVLDVLDDGDAAAYERRKALYLRFGFSPMLTSPRRLYLPLASVRNLLLPK